MEETKTGPSSASDPENHQIQAEHEPQSLQLSSGIRPSDSDTHVEFQPRGEPEQTNTRTYSNNQTNYYYQHVNYQQQEAPAPPAPAAETIYNQQPQPSPQPAPPPPPPPLQSYPQNITQPSADPNILYQTRSYHETTYHVPPQYMNMLPYIPGMGYGGTAPAPSVPVDPYWKTDLFGCLDDPMNALITVCLPCLTFDQIANIVDEGNTSCGTSGLLYCLIAFFIGIPCILSCSYRTRLRNRFGIVEDPASDWLTHFLCECCALCQEYRELQLRSWDPSIGWHGNIARKQNMQQQQPVMMPPMYQTMNG